MQVKVKFLENLRIESKFDDFTLISDQPIRYKGDGSAPGPFDYFLASSAMCAAYFVKVYCQARNIPTENIEIIQDNTVDPNNRYKQSFKITANIPDEISEKDKEGIIKSMDRCTVKRVIQNDLGFEIEALRPKEQNKGLEYQYNVKTSTHLPGKDASLEETITQMTGLIENLGIKLEIASWRNIIPHVWSVHIRDANSPLCFSNGKGTTKDAALCSALGEYLERLSCNYFYNDYFLGEELSNAPFVHYPNEKWFQIHENDSLPNNLMDEMLLRQFDPDQELQASHLIDVNSANKKRGICALPFMRYSDQKEVFIPVNVLGNLFVSNGMSAGNSKFEARVQALSEIFERAIKNKIISEGISLPDVPESVINEYPKIKQGIETLKERGFPIQVKDASLGGRYPVMCVILLNPKTSGAFASFGSHPQFEVALERCITELLQGRSLEGMNDLPSPTFSMDQVSQNYNLVEHFIDSSGVISWNIFSNETDYEFQKSDFQGSTSQEFDYLMGILKQLEKEVYIADYDDLGASACRIIVPGFSEIYEAQDLVWDNHNKGQNFRQRILEIHSLNQTDLQTLLEELEEAELDSYLLVSEFLGIAFDENSSWGRCSIGELKGMIHLALGHYEDAKQHVQEFLHYNTNLPERQKLYRLLDTLIDIQLDPKLKIESFKKTLVQIYGEKLFQSAHQIVQGDLNFYGLDKTDMNLTGITPHQKLIQSYKKLIRQRASRRTESDRL